MEILKHFNPDFFEPSCVEKLIAGRKNKSFNTIPGENSGRCTYTFNELGFRGDSINKKGFRIMSIGCSVTEGYGVSDNETWSHYLSRMIPGGVDLNFGLSSRSNDYISRCLLTYYDLIKPDLVIIFYTFTTRREYIDETNSISSTMVRKSKDSFWSSFKNPENDIILNSHINLSNEHQDKYNWYKNHLLIKNFLENKGCNWIWNGDLLIEKNYQESNRIDGGFLNDQNQFMDYAVDNLHPGPKTNLRYAQKLFSYIKKIQRGSLI